VPALQQIRYAIALMPQTSIIERRNRALLASAFLTGARESAVASFKLKHLDLEAGFVFQDAREATVFQPAQLPENAGPPGGDDVPQP